MREFADAAIGSLACTTAASAIRLESRTWRPISSTEAESCSVAVATDCILLEACSETPATWLDNVCVVSAVRVSVEADEFELHGRGRDVRHDGTDRALEIIGEADQLAAAGGARLLVLGFAGGGIALRLGDGLNLEFLDRAGHLADLVLAAKARQHDVEIARGQLAHRLAHRDHRTRDAGAEQEGEDRAEQRAADGQHQHQLLGLPDGRFRFQNPAAAVRRPDPPSWQRRPEGSRRPTAHLGDELVDHLGIGDQLLQRFAIGDEDGLGVLQAGDDLVVHGIDRAEEFSTNFSRASALVAIAWSDSARNWSPPRSRSGTGR